MQADTGAPHWHTGNTVNRVMTAVCLALLPGLLCYACWFGWGILVQCLLAVSFAWTIEFILLRLRRLDVRLYLGDGSALVTALLFALCIPPLSPWWVSLTGIAFAIVVAKHLFGGIGYNIFNPAMAGYAFVLVCFPDHVYLWPLPALFGAAPDAAGQLGSIFSLPGMNPDMISGATPLTELKTRLEMMETVPEIRTAPVFGHLSGVGWEWTNALFLLGGLCLLWRGVIKWHIPVAMLLAVFLSSAALHLYDPELYISPLFHLFGGATILCAFFVATDPVSAATTPRGRLVYGGLIGVLLCLLRGWGTLPDGAAFAVLIANVFVPLIDAATRPRVFGR